jgi:branched-chain amino acid transport system substrate-binding protein
MKRLLLLTLISTLALASPAAAQRRRVATVPSSITIGALFTLTGDGATLGIASAAALDLAQRDITLELDALSLPYHVETIVTDTAHLPANAAAQIATLDARGAVFVLGPQSSAEAAAVVAYANAHNIVVISQGSTASSLAIADNLFRLAPNDKLEGAATAALMHGDGIDTLVPVWRTDAGNIGLRDSTKRSFEALGGATVNGVSYDATTTDFTATVAALGAAVHAARASSRAQSVAVYIAAFDEAAAIFDLARLDPDLSAVRWYGGDGVTQSQALLAKASVAQFGVTTQFTAPNVGLDDATRDRWEPIANEIAAKAGFQPDAYALSVYDAAWIAALAAVESRNVPELRRTAFVRNAQRYWGLTGPAALDEFGDRKIGNFDFWTMRQAAGVTGWTRTAQYAGGHVSRP